MDKCTLFIQSVIRFFSLMIRAITNYSETLIQSSNESGHQFSAPAICLETSKATCNWQRPKERIAAADVFLFHSLLQHTTKYLVVVPCFICTYYSFVMLSMNCNQWSINQKVQNESLEIPKFILISSVMTFILWPPGTIYDLVFTGDASCEF